MSDNGLQKNDRVKWCDKSQSHGTVTDVREEVTGTSGEAEKKALMIYVRWDDGTQSCVAPGAVQRI